MPQHSRVVFMNCCLSFLKYRLIRLMYNDYSEPVNLGNPMEVLYPITTFYLAKMKQQLYSLMTSTCNIVHFPLVTYVYTLPLVPLSSQSCNLQKKSRSSQTVKAKLSILHQQRCKYTKEFVFHIEGYCVCEMLTT